MPFLSRISVPPLDGGTHRSEFPFLPQLPFLRNGLELSLRNDVTFFVGENGSGKSTLLEGIAEHCGFNLRGGNRNHNTNSGQGFDGYESPLAPHMRISWTPARISNGFFMRAESFFNFASYIDDLARSDGSIYEAYGGRSLHAQSHGESFLALFRNQFRAGIYLLDEPEAALSPARILALITIIHQLTSAGKAQFIIATHSPMLICYPSASIYHFGADDLREVSYQDTEHYQLTKAFLDNPDLYLRHLLEE